MSFMTRKDQQTKAKVKNSTKVSKPLKQKLFPDFLLFQLGPLKTPIATAITDNVTMLQKKPQL